MDKQRQEETRRIIAALEAAGGKKLADYWSWEMTPMPCGLPSDEQLAEGRKMAELAEGRKMAELAEADANSTNGKP
jgi:hypothetical protein